MLLFIERCLRRGGSKINSKTVSPMDTLGIELEDLEDQFEPDLIAAITAVARGFSSS